MNKEMDYILFGQIAEFRNGLNFRKESRGNGCVLIGVPDFKNRFAPDYESLGEINPDGIVKEDDYIRMGDILFVRSNGNKSLVGRSLYIDKDVTAVFSGFCIRARIHSQSVDKLFCAYYTKTRGFRSQIHSAAGTNINNLNQDILGDVRLPLFPKENQQKITAVLSSLDAKIECNSRINAELEAMAKTLYDYWFLQFEFPNAKGKPYRCSGGKMAFNPILKREIPDGWTNGTLNNLGKIVGGSTPSTEDSANFSASGTPWITPYDLSNNQGNKFISRGALDVSDSGLKDASLKKYPAGTVLLSSRAPVGYLAIARNELTTNQGFKSFVPSKGYSTAFIYYTVEDSLKAIIQYASGSTFHEISATVLKTVKIVLPPSEILDEFTKAIIPILGRQDLLEQENQQLTRLRDWLLPMLMNGQLSVE